MRVFFFWFLCLIFLLQPIASADGEISGIAARASVLIDRASGRILHGQNADELLPIASTTKIMTALLALERSKPEDPVTAGANASGVEGTSIYLAPGETLTMHQMLQGLMLRSGNDAAVAIAEHIAGSVEAFSELMNGRARALDAHAYFTNPHGLDQGGNGASALGLAKIACAALENPEFRTLVATKTATIPWESSQYQRSLSNKNRLLKTYEGATGVKTGFTTRSGRCLVFSAERGDMELVGVLLNCGTWFETGEALLDWGFENYRRVSLIASGEIAAEIPIKNGAKGYVCATVREEFALPVSSFERCELSLEIPQYLEAPVAAGQPVGKAHAMIGGQSVAAKTLYAMESVEKRDYLGMLRRLMRLWRIWP
jgi:D-alanyl-D-alanine carboxypeptidase (penicillin-binding protein 5/6)